MSDRDEIFMAEALKLAEEAAFEGEVPVGAVAILAEKIVGRGKNMRESLQDPTAHAEILALREAARSVGSWRLSDVELFVTLEPCPMCAGAIVNARVSRLVYGADDPKAGAISTLYQLCSDSRLNHRLAEIKGGVLAERSTELLKDFFKKRRLSSD
jgi:tRNA(adenine34) deaminase